jgi:hypothetical protein
VSRPGSPSLHGSPRRRSFSGGSPGGTCGSSFPSARIEPGTGTTQSRRHNHPGERRGGLCLRRSGSVLSVLSPSRAFAVDTFDDGESARDLDVARVWYEARATLEAKALTLAKETSDLNAKVATLEGDKNETSRLLQLTRNELDNEREAHVATRRAMRESCDTATRREAALQFTLDVKCATKQTRRETATQPTRRVTSVCVGTDLSHEQTRLETRDAATETSATETSATETSAGTDASVMTSVDSDVAQLKIETLTMELAAAHRAHDAATADAAFARLRLDESEETLHSSRTVLSTELALAPQRAASEVIEFVVVGALERLLDDAHKDSKRHEDALTVAQAELEKLATVKRDRDTLKGRVATLLSTQKENATALGEAQAVARVMMVRDTTREGELNGHFTSREDAIRDRDNALERVAFAERRAETETKRARDLETKASEAEAELEAATARSDAYAAKAREAEQKAPEAESRTQARVDALQAEVSKTRALLENERVHGAAAAGEAACIAKTQVSRLAESETALVESSKRIEHLETELDVSRETLRDANMIGTERLTLLHETRDLLRLSEETAAGLKSRIKTTRDAFDETTRRRDFVFGVFCVVLRNRLDCGEEQLRCVHQELRGTQHSLAKMSSESETARACVKEKTQEIESLQSQVSDTSAALNAKTASLGYLVTKQEEDEKRTRLQATYTKECEKRLTVAAAENIRMKRALDALGGEAALSSGR